MKLLHELIIMNAQTTLIPSLQNIRSYLAVMFYVLQFLDMNKLRYD